MDNTVSVQFVPSGRGKARCPSNPSYPDGIEIDITRGNPGCAIDLPYPAPECGHFEVRCRLCTFAVVITAAGRPDDPKKLILPCKTVFAKES